MSLSTFQCSDIDQVVLVDQSERFVFKPMLYELLSGGRISSSFLVNLCYCFVSDFFLSAEVDVWEIAPRFSDLLSNTGIQFLRDRVKTLLPCDHSGANGSESSVAGGTVLLESGFLIEYDWYYVYTILINLNENYLIRFLSCCL